jgi:hypothetical protein
MPTVSTHEQVIDGVPGIRFRTNAQPDTEPERQLQEIQSKLSSGEVHLSSSTTLPHLNFYDVATIDGPTQTFISLWVPKEQELQATELLEAADFTVA